LLYRSSVRTVTSFIAGVTALASLASITGCDNDCGRGQRTVQVQGPLGPKNEWVCVADPSYVVSTTATAGGGNAAAADDAGASPTFGCETADVYSADISMTTADMEPEIDDAAPPDGTYDLTDAISYGNAAIPTMRARLRIAGSSLLLGIQTTTPTLEPVESFTMGLTNMTLFTVCRVNPGEAAPLFPAPSRNERAHLAWDDDTGRLTLRVDDPSGDFDLIFVPFL
jgi:hypothetical protein